MNRKLSFKNNKRVKLLKFIYKKIRENFTLVKFFDLNNRTLVIRGNSIPDDKKFSPNL
jgi:hypothetical protein